MGAELVVEAEMAALVEEVEVVLADQGGGVDHLPL